MHPDQRRGLPCVESTAAGHNARPDAVAQSMRSQGRLALQPQLFSLRGALVGRAVHAVACKRHCVPLRVGISRPMAGVVIRAGDIPNVVHAHRNVRSRGINLGVARRVWTALPL